MSKQRMRKRTSPHFRQVSKSHIYTERDIALSNANAKVNIHIRLNAEIVNYFKEKPKQDGGRYQSLLNQHLRETVLKEHNLESRLQRIEEQLGLN